jgi:LacI family transcriptional regulator
VLDRRIPGVKVDIVRGDSEQGAYQLAGHLLGLGHRRIANLSGPAAVTTAADRVTGYRRALAEAGVNSEIIYYGDFSIAGGYDMACRALAVQPRPTALFAANNFIAIGAIRALREAGLRVPEDMSVVAFDDLPEAFAIDPFLTVMEQPAYEMGRRATLLLLDRLAVKGDEQPQEIILPMELIARTSSAPPG